jgi:hypothetical protein
VARTLTGRRVRYVRVEATFELRTVAIAGSGSPWVSQLFSAVKNITGTSTSTVDFRDLSSEYEYITGTSFSSDSAAQECRLGFPLHALCIASIVNKCPALNSTDEQYARSTRVPTRTATRTASLAVPVSQWSNSMSHCAEVIE